ncbi:hypothetical protein [Arthrobacter sp. TS-15]|uniref:hypothetical protein n=1 Tax=Arthrobacter sp. TS-15 TaxID=2510797 RepID=UPI001656CBCE|nr:hypothetical protein [Arthrobacter sp. TS-15]
MPDSSALWIAFDGIEPRTMYDAASGYEVWVQPYEAPGPNRFRFTSECLFPSSQPSI